MRALPGILLSCVLMAAPGAEIAAQAQPKRPPAKKAPARPAPKTPALTRAAAEIRCPSVLGVGVATRRQFCDVLTGQEPRDGIVVTVPPHRGAARLSFDLHNRHTYSEDLVREGRAFRRYTASIGVLTLDNTLVRRAVIEGEFRTVADLFDRIAGGAGPGDVKAVAPAGSESITLELPPGVREVSILGERLTVRRPDGTDVYTSPGRPVAAISNVQIEYQPAPPPPKRRPGG